jgi:glycosidase
MYHIYPLGFCGAPKWNPHTEPVNRIKKVIDWIPHLKEMNISALYLGPVFESVEHGYDTIDYKTIDNRLGTNEDFKEVCKALHEAGIKVILDGVLNHVGRDFWAFKDVQEKGQASEYCSWFAGLNFGGSSPCGDPFWYEGWNGFYNLVKLNQKNPAVCDYLIDAVDFWMKEFEIDGIRFDAADCLDFDFIKRIHHFTKSKREDFWLMGEIIHGDYKRWANPEMFDSVTNYECYKGIYSSHNTKNYFEIDYSINRQFGSNGAIYKGINLYNFVDNHDVNRLASTLENPMYLNTCYTLLYAMPGIPSIYYGSEYGIQGRHENNSDDGLRPCIELSDMERENTALYKHIVKLGRIYQAYPAMRLGEYRTIIIRNQQILFEKNLNGQKVYVALNLEDKEFDLNFNTDQPQLVDIINNNVISVNNGNAYVKMPPFTSMILVTDDIVSGLEEDKQQPETTETETVAEIKVGSKISKDGKTFEIIALAKDSETTEELIVYKADNDEVYVTAKSRITSGDGVWSVQ